jgi:hypothetical protein
MEVSMRKFSKKAFIATIGLVLGSLAGCGQEEGSSRSGSNEKELFNGDQLPGEDENSGFLLSEMEQNKNWNFESLTADVCLDIVTENDGKIREYCFSTSKYQSEKKCSTVQEWIEGSFISDASLLAAERNVYLSEMMLLRGYQFNKTENRWKKNNSRYSYSSATLRNPKTSSNSGLKMALATGHGMRRIHR